MLAKKATGRDGIEGRPRPPKAPFMNTRDLDEGAQTSHVSTGRLPPAELVRTLVAEAHGRYKSSAQGTNSQAYPALAEVASDLFGVCVVGTGGDVYAVGDAEYEFSIMSVSKPFVFALVCQSLGAEQARQKLGVNATGLPFNSLSAVERSEDGRTNPMVNAGAIATTKPRTRRDHRRQARIERRRRVVRRNDNGIGLAHLCEPRETIHIIAKISNIKTK